MGAILGGTMRSPFTSIVFAFELTHDANVFLPLLVGSIISHAFTVLTLKRSILTEKIARRGYHLSREYSVDPLELLYVREVMHTDASTVAESTPVGEALRSPEISYWQWQHLLPVLAPDGTLSGIVTSGDLHQWIAQKDAVDSRNTLRDVARKNIVSASPDEPLRAAVHRMAENGITRLPVVEAETQRFLGILSLDDLLKARSRHLEEERRREQVLRFPYLEGVRPVSPTEPNGNE
jgi:CIC family chloride channel protein